MYPKSIQPHATVLLPTAEHVLELGIRRAVWLIRTDRYDDALRALAVAGAAADLIETDAADLDPGVARWGPAGRPPAP